MDNQQHFEPWSDAEIAEWDKFWESKIGKRFSEKIKEIKNVCLFNAQNTSKTEEISAWVGRAAGVGFVEDFIQQGIITAKNNEEKENKAKKN